MGLGAAMTKEEAYKMGLEWGHRRFQLILPAGISPKTNEARAFELGYHDGLKGRRIAVRK